MEQINLAKQKPEKAKELETILDNYLIEVHAQVAEELHGKYTFENAQTLIFDLL